MFAPRFDAALNVVVEAGVRLYDGDSSRGKPEDVTPQALRHSVTSRMMNVETDDALYDVRNRLRHQNIAMTERIYDYVIEG